MAVGLLIGPALAQTRDSHKELHLRGLQLQVSASTEALRWKRPSPNSTGVLLTSPEHSRCARV